MDFVCSQHHVAWSRAGESANWQNEYNERLDGCVLHPAEEEWITRRQKQPRRQFRNSAREVLSLQLVMQQLKMDNENMRKQMNASEKLSESNRWVVERPENVIFFQFFFYFCSVKIKQENDMLKSYLKAAQDDISTLLDEKRTLMDTIRSLQDQLTSRQINYNDTDQR
jgi:hypothetical protein